MTKRTGCAVVAGLTLGSAAMAQSSSLDQSRAYASELLSDAGPRTSSLAEGAKDFTVKVNGFTQFRYNVNYRKDDSLRDNLTTGFTNTRTKVGLSGNVGNENWSYNVLFKFEDRGEGSAVLDDAYGTYKMGDGWKVMFGQFKTNLFREENMSDTAQLFANRSVNNSVFSQGRSQGIQLAYEADKIQFFGAFTDGIKTNNTDYESPREADYAFTGRLNYKWAGDWKQSKDFTSFRGSEYFGMIGAGGNYQSGGDTVGSADIQLWDGTIDVQIEGNGWNAFAAFTYQGSDVDGSNDTINDYGFVIQGGVFVSDNVELALGFNNVTPDGHPGRDDSMNTITLGANYYVIPESHAVKFTVDFQYFLDKQDQGIAPANTSTGLLSSADDNQWNLRGQIQIMF